MDLFAGPPEVAPLGVLDDVIFGQLFALAARELDQNSAAALGAITHWTHRNNPFNLGSFDEAKKTLQKVTMTLLAVHGAFIYFLRNNDPTVGCDCLTVQGSTQKQRFLPEMAFSPFGEATVIAEAFPMLSTGPRPTWLLKLRTCQPMTLASCWTAWT